ncbi:30S ribosomal protein S12 methylthiotransferase RimO [bacterium]|nr:30S ribosomal protein S12 methylthiotransferase RimO [bacterium]
MSITVRIVNLGCAKNLVDSERIAGLLEKAGCMVTTEEEPADCLIINTCAFIEDARKEAVETILAGVHWKEESKGRKLYTAGCLPQIHREALIKELPEVDGFFGVGDYNSLVKAVTGVTVSGGDLIPRKSMTPKHYRYLRIADGCDRKCSYCSIPNIRGNFHSRPMRELLAEAESLADEGAKEIIIIAQETCGYGVDLPEKADLPLLLRSLNKIEGIEWIRVHYLHPPAFSEEILSAFGDNDKVLPYFDFPIEHISDKILKRMKRGITRSGIEHWIRRIRDVFPDSCLRTSLMTGFPGEDEEDFNELADFIEDIKFDRLGVFIYSLEEGTSALNFIDTVPQDIMFDWQTQLLDIQRNIAYLKNIAKIGDIVEIIADEISPDSEITGRTKFDSPEIDNLVCTQGAVKPGGFIKVRITDADELNLYGDLVDE